MPEMLQTNGNCKGLPIWIMVPSVPLLIIASAVFFTLNRFSPRYDSREPPVLPQKVPFLGHILGLLQYGLKYYSIIR